jgi:hypothetical protein
VLNTENLGEGGPNVCPAIALLRFTPEISKVHEYLTTCTIKPYPVIFVLATDGTQVKQHNSEGYVIDWTIS